MFFKKSFRNRLITIFLGAVFIPITILSAVTYRYIYEYIVLQYEQETLENIINDTELVNFAFHSKASILKSLAKTLGYSVLDIENQISIGMFLKEQKKNIDKEVLNLYVVTKDGKKYDANFWTKYYRNVDSRKREWYQGAAKSDGIYISKPYLDVATKQKVITMSIPIKGKDGDFLGVLAIDYLFDNIIDQISNIKMDDEAFHVIADGDNILYDNSGYKDIEYNSFMLQPSKLVKLDYGNKKIIGAYTKLESINLGIITFQKEQDYYQYINRFTWSFIFIYTIVALVMLLFVLYICKRVSKPVMKLKKGVKEILEGNYETSLLIPVDDDFGEVIDSFNLMANTIKSNYESLISQSEDLVMKNELLQETYIELEASYEQLQATTEQLNYSETQYRTLIENISDVIWVTTPDGKITYINDSVKELLGYDPDELIGKYIFSIMCPLHKYDTCSDIVEEFRKRDFKNYDLWFLRAKSEERMIIATNINRILVDGKLVSIQGIGRDVTEKRRLQRKILKKNKELVTLNKISGILASKVKMDDLLNTIVDKIHELLRIETCTIRLLRGEELELKASSGSFKELIYKDVINIHKAISGKAVLEKRMVILRDVKKTDVYYNSDFFELIEKMNNLLFIPLAVNDQIIGVLSVGCLRQIDDVEIDILKAFSNHAAVAIEKARLYEDLKDSYFKTIKTLATAVEAKDSYTEGHSLRVAKYATLIAKNLGLSDEKVEEIYTAGILHDIGKIGIDDAILTKPGRLSEEEYLAITNHPTIGQKILSHIGLSDSILNGVLLHHKRYDLKGYPRDVKVNDLPLEACIIGAADAFDAITTTRSYSEARTIEEALDELIEYKGTQFCPLVVDTVQHICKDNRCEVENVIKP